MNWLEFMRLYDPGISQDRANWTLWNETCFGAGTVRMIVPQVLSSLRAQRNNVKRCWLCGWKEPYHHGYCLRKKGI